MGNEFSPLRIVGREEHRVARGPGLAVFLILLYAVAFAGALWALRSRSPFFHKASAGAAPVPRPLASRQTETASRSTLLSGADLPPLARDEYFRELASECCTCGCDLRLAECLSSDHACTRSPERADAVLRQLQQGNLR